MTWTTLLCAALAAADIWGPPLPPAPFDREPFRPVRIPAWLEETSIYGFGAEPADAACGVQMAAIGIGGCEAVYYPSKILPRDPRVPEDAVRKEIEAFRAAGIRPIAAIPPRMQAAMYAAHPDWRSRTRRDQKLPEVTKENPLGGALCLMGPWGDRLIDVLAEALRLFPGIAGYSFDGIHTSGACYCDHCARAYRAEFGRDIPDPDMNDPAFRRYGHWLDRRLEAFVRRMQERLKGIDTDCALVTWTTNAGRFGHFLDIPRNMPARLNLLFDSPGQEFWLDETNRGNSIVPAFANAYIWAATNGRHAHSEPYIMSHGNPYGTDSFPAPEMLRRVLLTITYGPRAALSFGWPGLRDAAAATLREASRRKAWLPRVESEPWAALLMSDDTRNFYGREPGKVEERYVASVLGAFRALVEEHLPATVIADWNLAPGDLARYRVLVVPNGASIAVDGAEAIRRFVAAGGGLVASLDASLFDEFGDPRKDFLLGDVLGVRFRGPAAAGGGRPAGGPNDWGEGSRHIECRDGGPRSFGPGEIDANFAKGIDATYWEKRKGVFDFKTDAHPVLDAPKLREYLGGRPVTFKGPATAVAVEPGASAIATMAPREGAGAALPAVVVRTFGKGRVVYLAAGLDAAYYLYPYPYQRLAIAGAVRWAAGEAPRIAVEAPLCVHATTFRQKKDGERLVVHLYSDLNTAGGHAKPDDDVPLREEVVPIRGIRVAFRGYRIARVHLEPEGADLAPDGAGDTVTVTVPSLEIHSMVVAELRP